MGAFDKGVKDTRGRTIPQEGSFDQSYKDTRGKNGSQTSGQTEIQHDHETNDALFGKIELIEKQLSEIKASMALQDAVKGLRSDGHGLNQIFDLMNEIKGTLSSASRSGVSQDQINAITNKITLVNTQLVGKIGESERKITSSISSVISKLNEVKNGLESAIKKVEGGSSSKFKPEHKVYLTWTTIFAAILIFSAIFIVRGYLTDFSNPLLLTWTFVIFCVSFVAVGIFNLVFSIADVDNYTADAGRIAYYIVCGILTALTFSMSASVLII